MRKPGIISVSQMHGKHTIRRDFDAQEWRHEWLRLELDPAWEAVIGWHRFGRVHQSIQAGLLNSLNSAAYVGITGAMRWPGNFRPEVLINCDGRAI